MPKYLFILGKNWRLSIAEIIELLNSQNIKFKVIDLSPKACIVETQNKLYLRKLDRIQERLGGTLKIGSILYEYNDQLLTRSFGKEHKEDVRIEPTNWIEKLWGNVKGKRIKFTISIYPVLDSKPNFDVVRAINYLNNKTKSILYELGAYKVRYYKYDVKKEGTKGNLTNPLWPHVIIKEKLTTPPNAEIMLVETYTKTYISRTATVFDSIWQQVRDKNRPYVNPEISTSPKLSRILINLTKAKKNNTILDPFCGTGTILMEALLMQMHIIGIDIDNKQVKHARTNLRWLAPHLRQQMNIKIIQGDATRLSKYIHENIAAVCTEPELGPVVKTMLQYDEALKIKSDLEKLYFAVLKEITKILPSNKRIAMTTPRFNTTQGIVSADIIGIARKVGLNIVKLIPKKYLSKNIYDYIETDRNLIIDKKPNQIVERQIIVLEK